MARSQRPVMTPARKRKESPDPELEPRSSKRLRTSITKSGSSLRSTPKKSIYWEGDDSQLDEPETSSAGSEASGYEDEDASQTSVSASLSEAPSDDSSTDRATKRRKTNSQRSKRHVQPLAKAKRSHLNEAQTSLSAKELLKEGVRTGLAPGKEVIIKAIKARDDGGIPYTPSAIHPNTMLFLQELRENNDREWLKTHDPVFRQAEQDWKSFLEQLTTRIPDADPTIPELPVKDIIYRIYRDVRFSPDKTPYKTNFSAYFSRTGRKGPYAGYYLQIAPKGHSLIAGGLWLPDADKLRVVRRSIDRHPERFKDALLTPEMREHVWDRKIKAGDRKAVVKAFANLDVNLENKLKTRPKDYEASHPDIELLKLKSFIALKRLPDIDVVGMGPIGLMERIVQLVGALQPFVEHMNSLVMPDPGQTPSDSESDGETENEADGAESEQ